MIGNALWFFNVNLFLRVCNILILPAFYGGMRLVPLTKGFFFCWALFAFTTIASLIGLVLRIPTDAMMDRRMRRREEELTKKLSAEWLAKRSKHAEKPIFFQCFLSEGHNRLFRRRQSVITLAHFAMAGAIRGEQGIYIIVHSSSLVQKDERRAQIHISDPQLLQVAVKPFRNWEDIAETEIIYGEQRLHLISKKDFHLREFLKDMSVNPGF